jgi:hypothetical protein
MLITSRAQALPQAGERDNAPDDCEPEGVPQTRCMDDVMPQSMVLFELDPRVAAVQ